MTEDELRKNYGISCEVLRLYGRCCPCDEAACPDDAQELSRLSLLLTLRESGFSEEEVVTYLRLLREGAQSETTRLRLLDEKRATLLAEIHVREGQLDRLDCLRHDLRKNI